MQTGEYPTRVNIGVVCEYRISRNPFTAQHLREPPNKRVSGFDRIRQRCKFSACVGSTVVGRYCPAVRVERYRMGNNISPTASAATTTSTAASGRYRAPMRKDSSPRGEYGACRND
jgi:hypothetical protein